LRRTGLARGCLLHTMSDADVASGSQNLIRHGSTPDTSAAYALDNGWWRYAFTKYKPQTEAVSSLARHST
jgi:hypothetical protein